jgi:ComF family protein
LEVPAGAVNLICRSLVDGAGRLQRAVFPLRCLLCDAPGVDDRDLCGGCAAALPRNDICCARCALPLKIAAALCGECLKREPPFASTFAPFEYGHPLDLLLVRLKFARGLAAGSVLARLVLDAIARHRIVLPQAIVPVPLHRRRLRERGYNQALELAKPVARGLGIPLCEILSRTRATAAQSDLDAAARRRNLKGAFGIVASDLPAHVALIDDVMTTGTTVRECARTLRRAGVERVDVWAVARARK